MNDLSRYLNDPLFIKWVNAPDDELDYYWDAWKRRNPHRLDEINEAVALLKSIKFRQFPLNKTAKEEDWEKIKAGTQSQNRYKFLITIYKAAAVILVAAAIGLSVFMLLRGSGDSDAGKVATLVKQTLPGQKLSLHLPDGTLVKLNSDSRLSYPAVFSDTLRKVVLTGEGYFEVARDTARPFVVESGRVTTRVLGTRFNVKGYDVHNVEVALLEGSVEVSSRVSGEVQKKLIVPGEKASWKNNRFNINNSDFSRDFGWKDNILSFNKKSIEEIKIILEKWYGVTIYVDQQEKIPESFNGEFQNETLSNVLESIGFAMNFQYSIKGRSVHIKPANHDE